MLQVQNISFSYSDRPNLKSIDFNVEKGAHVCLIGESGCGKSTLIKAVYGLLDLEEGAILWGEKQVFGPAFNLVPGEPYMKYLSQEFELMPFITVEENIRKFLSRQHMEKSKERADELLEVIDMTKFANTKVKLLSGGQKQRVALAQVLAKEPELLLLDEPFNFIDNFRKNHLRRNIFAYLKKQNITCLFSTHDSTDMFGFADQVLVLKDGKLQAKGSPEDLYENPPNKYVASLFNEVNCFSASLLNEQQEGNYLIYPSELKLDKTGKLSVKILKTYYNGNDFFIESITQNNAEKIFFKSDIRLEEGIVVQLKIEEELLKRRYVK